MNEAGFDKKFIATQREKLLKLKTKLMNNLKEKVKEEITDSDKSMTEEGEIAQSLTTQTLALRMHDVTLQKIRDIDIALQKIVSGEYGICEDTGEPIERKRLERAPWARLSIAAAEEHERENRKFHRVG